MNRVLKPVVWIGWFDETIEEMGDKCLADYELR